MNLALGTTYDFYIITSNISGSWETWFEMYSGSTLVWYLSGATGATALSVENTSTACNYLGYSDYVEVHYTDLSGGYPLFKFTFSGNEWYNGAGWVAASWETYMAGTVPAAVDVLIRLGRTVLLFSGTTDLATWAAAYYFEYVMYPNVSGYTNNYYIIRWKDGTANGFTLDNIPDAGDTFAIIAQGTA